MGSLASKHSVQASIQPLVGAAGLDEMNLVPCCLRISENRHRPHPRHQVKSGRVARIGQPAPPSGAVFGSLCRRTAVSRTALRRWHPGRFADLLRDLAGPVPPSRWSLRLALGDWEGGTSVLGGRSVFRRPGWCAWGQRLVTPRLRGPPFGRRLGPARWCPPHRLPPAGSPFARISGM